MASKRSLPGVQRTDAYLLDPDAVTLVTDEKHKLYDPRVKLTVDENLVLNIMVHGVIEPIVVRTGTEPPEVIDGRQRVKAAREANLRLRAEGKEPVRVLAVRRRGEDSDLFGVLCSANEHRHEDDPVEKARKAQRLLNMGRTNAEVCVTFGWSLSALTHHLRLLDIDASVRSAVSSGDLSVTAASKLGSLPLKEQGPTLEKLQEGGGKPTVKAAAHAAGKTTKPRAPGKVAVRRVVSKLNPNSEMAKWFTWGAEWATGGVTSKEVADAGLVLPEVT